MNSRSSSPRGEHEDPEEPSASMSSAGDEQSHSEHTDEDDDDVDDDADEERPPMQLGQEVDEEDDFDPNREPMTSLFAIPKVHGRVLAFVAMLMALNLAATLVFQYSEQRHKLWVQYEDSHAFAELTFRNVTGVDLSCAPLLEGITDVGGARLESNVLQPTTLLMGVLCYFAALCLRARQARQMIDTPESFAISVYGLVVHELRISRSTGLAANVRRTSPNRAFWNMYNFGVQIAKYFALIPMTALREECGTLAIKASVFAYLYYMCMIILLMPLVFWVLQATLGVVCGASIPRMLRWVDILSAVLYMATVSLLFAVGMLSDWHPHYFWSLPNTADGLSFTPNVVRLLTLLIALLELSLLARNVWVYGVKFDSTRADALAAQQESAEIELDHVHFHVAATAERRQNHNRS
eukprot:TRINITY_DN66482_c1_g1_i1.p1 TRINITY_DN66482_c1_g1~~TRINITY_DN66482_c1_g1_i1.p1  ORF type:complete len:410 (+),score=189.26 TRINITY_DN66482_c1_g1_i1:31-1260(+)